MTAEKIQERVTVLVEQAVGQALQFDRTLDFTRESIETVDEILDYFHILLHHPTAKKPSEQQVYTMAMAWGAYIGEVMRREIGADCVWTSEDVFGDGEILHILIIGKKIRVFPLDKALKRLENGPVDDIRPFFNIGISLKHWGKKTRKNEKLQMYM